MNKILETLTEEIKSLFPDSNSEKRISDELKNLKTVQKSFAPTGEFRANLKSRLEWIYTIEHWAPVHHFSFLRYVSVFTSFILVVWVWYIIYDVNKSPIESVMQQESVNELPNELPEVRQGKNLDVDAVEIKNQILQKSLNDDVMWEDVSWEQEQNNFEESENIESQAVESLKRVNNEEKDQNLENVTEINKQVPPVEKEAVEPRVQEIDNTSIVPSTWEVQGEPTIMPKSIENDSDNNLQTNDDIESLKSSVEPSMMMDSMMQDGDMLEESSPNMFGAENSQAIYQEKVQSFAEVCEEYNWVISDAGEICILENGKQCNMEDIHSCALTGSWGINLDGNTEEIFLQELIDEFGQ